MGPCCDGGAVVSRILGQGARREEAYDDQITYWFSLEWKGKTRYFQIPKPPRDGMYWLQHLNVIEVQLQRVGLDLLPIDAHSD